MPLLVAKELCAHLKISRSSLARLRKAGLPSVGHGRLSRYNLDEAIRWYDEFSTQTPTPGLLFAGVFGCQKCHYVAEILEPTDITSLQVCPKCSARERPTLVDASAV